MTLSKRSIERRNERINGYHNARDLQFMSWVKSASIDDLRRRMDEVVVDWQYVALNRELNRRTEGRSEGIST